MEIRLERPEDYPAVEALTREAFWNVYRPGCQEHYILHKLRSDSAFLPELDYCLEEDGEILAHIAYALGSLELPDGRRAQIPLFGPVSVLPAYQGRGYGGRLIRETLERARILGYPLVVITGSPAYYHRFGFVSASAHGIYYAGVEQGEENPVFMVKILNPDRAAALKGTYSDPEVYFVSDAEVAAFDLHFPPKEKKVLPGQLG